MIKYLLYCMHIAAYRWLDEMEENWFNLKSPAWRNLFEAVCFITGCAIGVFVPMVIAILYLAPAWWSVVGMLLMWWAAYLIFNFIRRTYNVCRSQEASRG